MLLAGAGVVEKGMCRWHTSLFAALAAAKITPPFYRLPPPSSTGQQTSSQKMKTSHPGSGPLTHTLGYPRIGADRELKKATEAHWRGEGYAAALEAFEGDAAGA